jgi:hypothetical protein
MIEKSGKVAMSNGERTIWVNSAEVSAWVEHGYAAEQSAPTKIVMKAPANKPEQDQSEQEENQE